MSAPIVYSVFCDWKKLYTLFFYAFKQHVDINNNFPELLGFTFLFVADWIIIIIVMVC